MILIVLGGSCSGKTQFALACEKYKIRKVITNTTRGRREDDGENAYHFLTKEQFLEKVDKGEMVEYAEYNGNFYGVSIDSLSRNCVVVLEPNGFRSLKSIMPNRVFSIFLDVSDEERLRRGIARGDNPNVIKSRIEEDKKLFNENLKSEVDLVVRDLTWKGIPEIIESNFGVIYEE